jgi:syringomycin synthetase protein SyrE
MRVRLLHLEENHHLLLLLVHHIVTDGWSLAILVRELEVLYMAYMEEKPSPLAPLELQYADYAVWQRNYLQGEVLEQQLQYWKVQLAGLPESPLIAGNPCPEAQSHRGCVVTFDVNQTLVGHLEAMARQEGVTLFMITLAVYQMMLSKYSTQEDVAVGAAIANRNRVETEDLIGFFVNTLVLRARVRKDQPFRQFLSCVRKTTLDAYRHQDLPFEKLVEELQPHRDLGQTPLFRAMLVFQNLPQLSFRPPRLTLEVLEDTNPQVRSDLDLYLESDQGILRGRLVYDVARFDAATIDEMAEYFHQLLGRCVSQPEAGLMHLMFDERPKLPPILLSGQQLLSAPLSYHQDKLWFVDRFETGVVYQSHPVYYNIPLVLRFTGRVDSVLLERSLNAVIERHDALHTKIISQKDSVTQVAVTSSAVSFSFRRVDPIELISQQDYVIQYVFDAVEKPFALGDAPPLRAILYEGLMDGSVLILAIHHILADRVSLQHVAAEVAEIYRASCERRAANLPEPKVQYGEYARWQRELPQKIWDPYWMFWCAQLRGNAVNLELPQTCSRHPVHVFEAAVHQFRISRELAEELKKVQVRAKVSGFEAMFAAFYVLLHLYSGQEGFLVGILDRSSRTETEHTVGPLANLFVLDGHPKDQTLAEFLSEVAKSHRLARSYSDMPFDLLVNRLKPPNDMSRTALFDVLFDCEEEPARLLQFGPAAAQVVDFNLGYGKYDINLYLRADDDGWAGSLVYNRKLYDRQTIEQMARHWHGVLASIVADIDTPVSSLSLLSSVERHQQIEIWNATESNYPAAKNLCQLFEEQAHAGGERIAASFEDQQLSYAELNQLANRLAHFLIGRGVRPDAVVGICFPRSLEMVVAILGVLKAGGAYLPLDPLYPQERLKFMLDDAGVSHVVTLSPFAGLFNQFQSVTLLDADFDQIRGEQSANPTGRARPENLAYCIYTSGSTGKPNGVMVEHRQVVRLMNNDRFYFDCGPEDTWVLFHSYAFDFSVWELWGALLNGARLVVMDRDTVRDPARFAQRLLEEEITILNQTPLSFYNLAAELMERRPANLSVRYVIFGGEALQPAYLARWKAAYPAVKLINMYGITETTVHVTFHEIDLADIENAKSNIGIPLPTTRTYILNRNMELVAVGVPGQIYVGGEGLARGYVSRSELTALRFVPDAVSGRFGNRLYQTGDLARYLLDGTMEYLGRIDHQVKVRGYRIELGEIESTLAGIQGVKHAVVLLREDRDGDKRLVGYIVGEKPQGRSLDELKNELRLHLPAYMVPEVLIELEAFPLTENGKVDRGVLPPPDGKTRARSYTAPTSAAEQILCGIYEEVLRLKRVGVEDDFFALGGHSLLATQVASRVREAFGIDLPLRSLFEGPTVRELALNIDRHLAASGPLRPTIRQVEAHDNRDLEEQLVAIEALSEEDAADLL